MIRPALPDHVGDPVSSPSVVNVPNGLTMMRLLLVPVFAWLLLREGGDEASSRVWAAAVFLVASATDLVDGELARRQGQVTTFGKVADPIADKILVIGTLIALIRTKELEIPLWAVFIIVIRELLIGGVRVIAGSQGKVLAADRWGKIKTAVQLIVIQIILGIVILKDRDVAASWMVRSAYPMTVLCAVLALSSLGAYLRQYRAMLEKSWS